MEQFGLLKIMQLHVFSIVGIINRSDLEALLVKWTWSFKKWQIKVGD